MKLNSLDFYLDIRENYSRLSKKIKGKNVLVIGGAGTIGSNYIKEVLHFKPSTIVVVDFNENALAELTRDLRSSKLLDYKPLYISYPINLLSSIFDKVFYSFDFEIIANFSAHKHVRSEKDILSIEALIQNNIFGTIKLLELCVGRPPEFLFSVSTDKATKPVNIMGASKSLMEKLILSLKNNLRVSTARFANVAFSNGSLLESFNYRISKRQPLSCPSNVKRFFVTKEQSGQICLLATFMGESGNIFFPKLDFYKDQIYFKDIALNFLKNLSLEAYMASSEADAKNFSISDNSKKYPIYFYKSDTTGEKLYEEFYSDDETLDMQSLKTLGVIYPKDIFISFDILKNEFNSLFSSDALQKIQIVNFLNKYIHEFSHIEKGKNLDQKM